MGKIIKLYNTWEKAKDLFVKPSPEVYFGKWKNDPNLPVWRRGPYIYLFKKKYRWSNNSIVHELKNRVLICTGEVPYKFGDKEYKSKCYDWSEHKLPGKLRAGDYIWSSPIRRKLRKWHLSWIPPVIKLPIWLSFHIFNWDLGWKTKWDMYRYEFPPQFTIVAFGLSLTCILRCPIEDEFSCEDHYWESMLNYILGKTLKGAIEGAGIWSRRDKDNKDVNYFALRPGYIIPDKLEEYYAITSDIKAKKERIIL